MQWASSMAKARISTTLGELQETRHEQTLRRDEKQTIAARGKLFFGFLDRVRQACRYKALAAG